MSEEKVEIEKDDASATANESYGISDELSKELLEALEGKQRAVVKGLVDPLHSADIADFIEKISPEQRRSFVKYIRKNFAPEILVEINNSAKEDVIGVLGARKSAEAINTLENDDAVEVMENLTQAGQQVILEEMPENKREQMEESLSFPEDSAGRLLDKKIVCVPEFWTVGQTIDFLRSNKDLPRDFYQIFVSDPKMKPVGGVLLSHIMCSNRSVKIKDIMSENLKTIKANMDQEEVAFIFRQYGLVSAPVVNEDGRMIGIITVDDIVHVIEEEAQEDILRLGGISETDIHTGFAETTMSRFPWLIANLVTAIIASVVIGLFEETIEKLAALAVLMPIVASMGGNAGTQSITVTVRAIATKELTSTNMMRVVKKELLVGGLNGIMFAIITGILSYAWYGSLGLSLVFAIATIFTLLLAGLSGTLVPVGLVKLGVDPAIASSVLLTTITDIVAFGVFLGFATMILF
ncbi:MAG: magnesium transporter [Alphaproteobacteria bacterium CG11_big_fil_rev_8_21_14_0_20_39_49]|nr:MAG: magnesium transporter [Alphaproteobacteria bacterium CG11_big_fil_rev_8_21_14_0_20_39_49]